MTASLPIGTLANAHVRFIQRGDLAVPAARADRRRAPGEFAAVGLCCAEANGRGCGDARANIVPSVDQLPLRGGAPFSRGVARADRAVSRGRRAEVSRRRSNGAGTDVAFTLPHGWRRRVDATEVLLRVVPNASRTALVGPLDTGPHRCGMDEAVGQRHQDQRGVADLGSVAAIDGLATRACCGDCRHDVDAEDQPVPRGPALGTRASRLARVAMLRRTLHEDPRAPANREGYPERNATNHCPHSPIVADLTDTDHRPGRVSQ